MLSSGFSAQTIIPHKYLVDFPHSEDEQLETFDKKKRKKKLAKSSTDVCTPVRYSPAYLSNVYIEYTTGATSMCELFGGNEGLKCWLA